MGFEKFARPLNRMMRIAIANHRKHNNGDLPDKFVFHPAVVNVLKAEMAACLAYENKGSPEMRFEGVLIEEDRAAKFPALITSRKEWQLL